MVYAYIEMGLENIENFTDMMKDLQRISVYYNRQAIQ